MLSSILFQERHFYLRLGVGILCWMLTLWLLLTHYGLSAYLALADTILHTSLLVVAVFALDKIFRYFTPRGKQFWITWFIPLIPTFIISYVGWYALQLIFPSQSEAQTLWSNSLEIRLFISYVLLLAFALLLNVFGRLESQREIQARDTASRETAREAELYHLRQQLQPHFLFNSLNSINALIGSDKEQAREMIVQLSEFLRETVRKDHQSWVTVQNEMDYVKQYLDIERIRFGHRLKLQLEIEDDAASMLMPQLLLQPLVENAIKFGLYGLTGEVLIALRAYRQGSYLMLEVSNPFDIESKPDTKGTGFGLQAIHRRLYLLFGRYDLLESSEKEGIFIVTLKIPPVYDQNPTDR